MEVEEPKKDEKENKEEKPEKLEKPEKPVEPTFEILQNPARVTKNQFRVISYDVDPRYTPIVKVQK